MRICLAIVAGLASSYSAKAEPLEFKGIPLGIALEQFRQTAHPDGQAATPDCTGDLSEGRDIRYVRPRDNNDVRVSDPLERTLGVTYCVFRSTEPLYRGGPTGTLGLAIGSSGTIRYTFKFVPDHQGVPRLFEIDVVAPPIALESIRQPLTDRYGEPDASVSIVQNSMGATFDRETLIWRQDDTTLIIQSPAERIYQMSLKYTHDGLSARIENARQAEGARPNRI